ncbi:hypothetical protein ACWCYY_13305 [Kitasatospora sp. NPDC001664]
MMTTPTLSAPPKNIARKDYYRLDRAEQQAPEPLIGVPKRLSDAGEVLPSKYVRTIVDRTVDREPPARHWQHAGSVTELLGELVDELVANGRSRDADAIQRLLHRDDEDAAMRAYVSRLWAQDWDSDEDSIYDE